MNQEKPKVNKTLKKIAINLVVYGLGTLSVLVLLGYLGPKYQEYKMNKLQIELEEQDKKYIEALKQDTYGGKTPEETIKMLIEALKQNDPELASKYYVLRERENALKGFEEEVKKYNRLDLSFKYFSQVKNEGKKICNNPEGLKKVSCNFEYRYTTTEDRESKISGTDKVIFIPKGSERRRIIDLEKNPYTGLWKVVQP